MSSEIPQNEKRRRHERERSPESDRDKVKSQFDPANPFTEGSSPDDVELKFDDGRSLFVSKTFLMYASPVFELMLQSNFREKLSNSITMQGKSYNTFLQLLLHIHPRTMKKVTVQSARNIYTVAHEYQMTSVLDSCADVIIKTVEPKPFSKYAVIDEDDPNFDLAFELLQFAEKYNDSRISSSVVKCISRVPIEYIKDHPVYRGLTDSSKNLILERRLERYTNPPRCAPGEYPRNPAYANQIPAFAPGALPPPSNIGGSGGNDFIEGAAVGYMLGHGGAGMLSGIDGGPRMAIGGNYVGL